MMAANTQQFFHFEILGEMLGRLATSANIVSSAQAQFAEERQNSIIQSLLFSWDGFAFVSIFAFAYNKIHFNYGQYNEKTKFCTQEEA